MKDICVITFTVDRVKELIRCIESVKCQSVYHRINHIVFSENASKLENNSLLSKYIDSINLVKLNGEPHQGSSSPRMAKLRQESLSYVKEKFVCFLDDDNEMEKNHLEELVNIIEENQVDASYSWRTLLNDDGSYFDGKSYPWHNNEKEAKKRWEWCLKANIISIGSPIMKDGPVQIADPMNLATIDMNEWLFKTQIIKDIGFTFDFNEVEIKNNMGEDDKLFSKVLKSGINIRCSELPSIRYYLGGVSNYDKK